RLRRPLLVDAGHERPARRLHAQALGNLVVHLLDAHAEPANPGLAVFAQLLDHRQRRLHRPGETDTDRPAGGRDDRRVDADDFALEVEQRPARVAAVDRGVGLNAVVVGPGIELAVAPGHDAGGDAAAEAERIADRDHPFAQPYLLGVAELHRLERLVGLPAQQRDVGFLTPADQLGLELGAVVEDDVDLVGFRDHVIVGYHDSLRIDDEAGAERIDAARRPLAVLLAAAVAVELLEQLFERRARRKLQARAPFGIDHLRGGNIDDRADDPLAAVGDPFRPAPPARPLQRG